MHPLDRRPRSADSGASLEFPGMDLRGVGGEGGNRFGEPAPINNLGQFSIDQSARNAQKPEYQVQNRYSGTRVEFRLVAEIAGYPLRASLPR